MSDMVPYDDPQYDEELQEMAEEFADAMMNGYAVRSYEPMTSEMEELPF